MLNEAIKNISQENLSAADKKAYGSIYLIHNSINDKVYVGQTTQSVSSRFSEHKYAAKIKLYESRLYSAIRKHGIKHFFIIEVAQADSQEHLDELETNWIADKRSAEKEYGYNLLPGGGRGPHTEETKEKCSTTQRLRFEDESVLKAHKEYLIKGWSNPDARARASAAAKKRLSRPEALEAHKTRAAIFMKDPDTRQKLREATARQFADAEYRLVHGQRIRTAMQDPETLARHRAKMQSPESRAKKSAAAKLRWEKHRANKLTI
jgi:group I intron endonuclease